MGRTWVKVLTRCCVCKSLACVGKDLGTDGNVCQTMDWVIPMCETTILRTYHRCILRLMRLSFCAAFLLALQAAHISDRVDVTDRDRLINNRDLMYMAIGNAPEGARRRYV